LATTRLWPPPPDQVVEAFVRELNTQRGTAYEIAARPDTTERARPAIDYVLRDAATNHEIAVEASSIWRSEDAGKEDSYLGKWFERVRRSAAGRVPGFFHIRLPIRVPFGADADRFAEELIATISENLAAIVKGGQQGKSLPFTVAGIAVWILQLPTSTKATRSDIRYARPMPDMQEFPSRIRTCLDNKAPKLKPYSDAGIETWIVIYNTMGVTMSPFDAERIVREQCDATHAHVTHIALVDGNPPDGAWVQVVR